MNVLVFLGSVRDSTPPKPARLGLRVARAMLQQLGERYPQCHVGLVDPMDYELGALFKPHFAYSRSTAPSELTALAQRIEQADAYVMISPEYNHSMSPALAHLLNHFGSSLYSYKPSAIVSYSAGQWGGTRAAVAMRTFLSELGCLPISAMIHIPKAHEVLSDDGKVTHAAEAQRWADYFGRSFAQLMWWAEATQRQRALQDPHQMIQSFKRNPSQRNAP